MTCDTFNNSIQIWSDSDAGFDETSKLFRYLTSSTVATSVKSFSLLSSQAASSTSSINSLALENGFKFVVRLVYLWEGLDRWSFQALVLVWAYPAISLRELICRNFMLWFNETTLNWKKKITLDNSSLTAISKIFCVIKSLYKFL